MPDGFRTIQESFTRHIRDPDSCPAPADIEERRMAIYRDLFYRNVEGFMAKGFPVLRKITPDEKWHALIRDYFRQHRAKTPLFPKMGQEFLHYLKQEYIRQEDDYPFMLELAYYEWVEAELSLDTREISMSRVDPQGDLLQGVPVMNPLVIPVSCSYPVHRISPDYLPLEPPATPTYILVYRNRRDRIGFLELNPVSARLFALLNERSGSSGLVLLNRIVQELQHPQPDTVIRGGMEIMRDMCDRELILGTALS